MTGSGSGSGRYLPHQRLRVYWLGEEIVGLVYDALDDVPLNLIDLRSQAIRCATSIPANIAEGASELTPGAKARYYRIARASAGELGAHVRSFGVMRAISAADEARILDHLRHISAMLYRLIQRFTGK